MQSPRLLVLLTVVNLAIPLLTCATTRTATVQGAGVAPVLRGRSLEIVDDQGRVRASISVLPAGTSAHGDAYPETVLLRLITERGRPSVKISASEEGAGLNLSGPTRTKDTYLILEAKGTSTSLVMRNENGREQVVRP
jgi:hypothetical protein